MVSASSSTEEYSARLVRTRLRTSACRPSSSRVSAATSTFGWTYSEASVSSAPLSWVWAVSVAMAGRYRTECARKTLEVGLGAPEKGHNSHLEGWFLHAGGLRTGVEVGGNPVVHGLEGHRPAGARRMDDLAAADVERDVVDGRG